MQEMKNDRLILSLDPLDPWQIARVHLDPSYIRCPVNTLKGCPKVWKHKSLKNTYREMRRVDSHHSVSHNGFS